MEIEEIKLLVCEYLAKINDDSKGIRELASEERLEILMTTPRRAVFLTAIGEIRGACVRALGCLMPEECPTTEYLADELIERWQAMNAGQKEILVARLRAAFTKEKP